MNYRASYSSPVTDATCRSPVARADGGMPPKEGDLLFATAMTLATALGAVGVLDAWLQWAGIALDRRDFMYDLIFLAIGIAFFAAGAAYAAFCDGV